MKLNSIVLKLGATIMALFLIVLLPLGFAVERIFSSVYYHEVQQSLDELSLKLAQTWEEKHLNGIHLDDLGNLTEKEIVLFDQKGKVISPGRLREFQKGDTVERDIVKALKKGNIIHQDYLDSRTDQYFFMVGRPLRTGETFEGGVLVFSSINEIHQSLHNVRNGIILALCSSILLALAFTWFVAKKMAKPLLQMERATREIAKGNLHSKVMINAKDEIGSLATAINDLRSELNHYRTNRSEFLANISHELRTPISYLIGYAQVLKNHQYQNKKELEQYSGIIESEGNRLIKLIQDLFELSKMEEGRIKLFPQWIDVEDMIEQAVQKATLKAKQKGLKLDYKVENSLPLIWSDGSRIEQVLFNLIENAIHYTEEGHIEIKAWEHKNRIFISVKDTGLGIPENDLPFIFDRFHRVEKSRSRKMGGTGLGLAIVQQIIKVLEGNISVQSELGKGTTFVISFAAEEEGKPLGIEADVH